MSPFLGCLDPLNPGKILPPTDPHFSQAFYYYDLVAIYTPQDEKAATQYITRTWHDYAVSLLQTAEHLNITTRPPGFRAAPVAPNRHLVTIDKNYNVSVIEGDPVAPTPPDPDPSKQAIAPDPKDPNDNIIVNLTPASKGAAFTTVTATDVTTLKDSLANLTKDQILQILLAALMKS